MKYNVSVEAETEEERKYVIDVSPVSDLEVTAPQNEEQVAELGEDTYDQELTEKIQITIESSRLEYEHSFRRAERLDNKVYILLTVCGFIFVLLTGAIYKISVIDVFDVCDPLIAIYDFVLVLSIVGTVVLLIILILALSGKEYKRYDSFKILEKNLISDVDRKTLAKYTIIKYEVAKDYNNKLVSNQFKRINMAVRVLIAVVILLMLLTILGNVVPTKSAEIDNTKSETAVDEAVIKETESDQSNGDEGYVSEE